MVTSADFQQPPEARVICGDALAVLSTLEAGSVHCSVSSPPYYSLRDYNLTPSLWPAVTYAPLPGMPDITIPEMECCLGLEPTLEAYVGHIVAVYREVWRVLRDDATCWVNLGDSFVGGPTGHQDISSTNGKTAAMFAKGGRYRVDNFRKDIARIRGRSGLKAKDLMGVPWRCAFALQADGWYLRSSVVWCKRAPMPESTRDRPTTAHEMVYLFAKNKSYFYDQEAERVPQAESMLRRTDERPIGPKMLSRDRGVAEYPKQQRILPNGRNLWSYWLLSPDAFPLAHFATFPRELARRCISLGTSAYGCCSEPGCGAPWARVVERAEDKVRAHGASRKPTEAVGPNASGRGIGATSVFITNEYSVSHTVGWAPTCTHSAPVTACTVLDPFSGAGTSGVVAVGLGRGYLGIELSPVYTEMSERRIAQTQPALPGMAV